MGWGFQYFVKQKTSICYWGRNTWRECLVSWSWQARLEGLVFSSSIVCLNSLRWYMGLSSSQKQEHSDDLLTLPQSLYSEHECFQYTQQLQADPLHHCCRYPEQGPPQRLPFRPPPAAFRPYSGRTHVYQKTHIKRQNLNGRMDIPADQFHPSWLLCASQTLGSVHR